MFLSPTLAYRDNIIRLVVGGEVSLRRDQDMFDHNYVLDCLKEKMILPNLLDYRINSNIPSPFQQYDPIDVLLGYKKWRDIPKVEGDKISDIEDFVDDDAQDTHRSERQALPMVFKSYRIPYSKKQEQEIVNFLVKHSAYKMIKGNSIWQRMEETGVCKGDRTWQSMKEHFRKKIIHVIHSFGLSWRQVRKFRAPFGLDEEHESDVDEDEEEEIEVTNVRETLFKPRRTSSPIVSSPKVVENLSETNGDVVNPTIPTEDDHQEEEEDESQEENLQANKK